MLYFKVRHIPIKLRRWVIEINAWRRSSRNSYRYPWSFVSWGFGTYNLLAVKNCWFCGRLNFLSFCSPTFLLSWSHLSEVNKENKNRILIAIRLQPVWSDWAIYWTLATFQSLLHSLAIFVKVSKSLISFLGNFYRHLAIFYWSHWFAVFYRLGNWLSCTCKIIIKAIDCY